MTDPATVEKWVQLYAGACEEVLATAQACNEPAQQALYFRGQIDEHLHDAHPITLRGWDNDAEQAEAAFAQLYLAFVAACDAAASAAAELVAVAGSKDLAERAAFDFIDAEPWPRVSTANAILLSHHGPSPQAFNASVAETNAIIQARKPEDGVVYTPPAPAESDERVCPWCAETIKAAAVICRFCNRDVQVQPNIAG